jgi:LacI family transcriptional regulator
MRRAIERVTMQQIAQDAGVSIGAVSAVVNQAKSTIGVGPETRKRIEASVRRLGYRVNVQARSLRIGRTLQIGAALDDITVPFLAELILHTGTILHKHSYNLMLFDVTSYKDERTSLHEISLQNRVDALLLAGSTRQISNADILSLEKRHQPVVLLERKAPHAKIRCVEVDNLLGGHLAAAHLSQQGCRRLAFIRGPKENPMSNDRLAGARAACPAPAKEIALATGDWSMQSGFAATRELLNQFSGQRRIDGIFAFNDMMAIGALRAIREAGLRPGMDIAVIGFDDVNHASFAEPALSTVRQPVTEMAAHAARLLLDAVGDPDITCLDRHVVCKPELVIRASSLVTRTSNQTKPKGGHR